jgi:hypothetical protein
MFGHHDDDSAQSATETTATEQADTGVDPQFDATAAQDPTDSAAPDTATPNPATATGAPAVDPSWQHPGTPLSDDNSTEPAIDPSKINDIISPAGGYPKRPTFSSQLTTPEPANTETPAAHPTPSAATSPSDEELLAIRKKALNDLAPIVDKLDLPPLEKFRTIMMIIQVNDDEALVKAAYAAAHAIPDEKDRGQALLDIVNEVNYFTHQQPET